jgi:Flp pilus assembly protein TadD
MIAHLNIGRILRTQGDFNGAKSALQSARRSCDTHETCGIVDNGLGLVYADLGDWTSAAVSYSSAAEMQPNNAGWHSQKLHAEAMVKKYPPGETQAGDKQNNQQQLTDAAAAHLDAEAEAIRKKAERRLQLHTAVAALTERIATTRPPNHKLYHELSAVYDLLHAVCLLLLGFSKDVSTEECC